MDADYEATRQKFYPNDPPESPAQKNGRGMYVVEEVIHHGDYRSVRRVEVYDLNEATVDAIVQSSAYCYGSWAHADEYREHRAAALRQLVEDLKAGRVNRHIGWSTFRTINEEDR